ncbi:MAG: hypothetical protein ACHQQ3_06060 [Gemmatimonadales bacterium]
MPPDALRYWEIRRLWYNLALGALALAWVVLTWPHFRPALTLGNLGRSLVLAALANACYSAAYVGEAAFGDAALWRRARGVVWTAGTLFALLFACYWIADEIYPFVQ